MKSLFLVIMVAVAPFFAFAGTGINLSDAISKHIVKMDAVTTVGKYTGKVLRLTLTNTGSTAIDIKVNTGMILKPADPRYNQLVLPGGESVTLKAHETSEVDVQAFSSNGLMACPSAGLHYTYYRMCGEVMGKVVDYVRAHGFFDHLGQAAVWAISNYLELNCVFDRNKSGESEQLIAHIVAVTKRTRPTYYTTYTDHETPGQRAYSGKADMVYVPFDISLPSPKAVSFAVYSTNGEFIQRVGDPQMVMGGKHSIMAEITPTDFTTGRYSVRAMRGDQILGERVVLIEQPWISFKD